MNDLDTYQYRKNDLLSFMEKISKLIDQEHLLNGLFPGAIDAVWKEAIWFDISLQDIHAVYWFYENYQFKNEANKLYLICKVYERTEEAKLQGHFEWNGLQWINKDGNDLHWYLQAIDQYKLDIY